MKKYILFVFLLFIEIFCVMAQKDNIAKKQVLFAYELNDKNIDPWRKYFRSEFNNSKYILEEVEALRLKTVNIQNYDLIIIYGAVMAFTSKEPIRDWLNTKPKLSGKRVGLFVTANRWFLKKYNDQLTNLLRRSGANIIDAVSTATKNLTENEKVEIVHTYVEKIMNEK